VKSQLNLGKHDDISKVPLYKEVKYGDEYFDCGITEKGYGECERAMGECKELDIGLVLTSPLYRAIVSGNEAFKGHKNNPRFIVEPLLGERMTSACDLGAGLRKTMEKFPEYDYSQLVDNGIVDTWYIENLPI
jgi:broad specificity phosphatase PhoE